MGLKLNKLNNSLMIDLNSAGRTKQQRHAIGTLVKQNDLQGIIDYLSSFNGRRNRSVRDFRIKTDGRDHLGTKSQNSILDLFNSTFSTSSEHRPIGKSSQWIGVEIECFVPIEDHFTETTEYEDCENCRGRGTFDCDDEDCCTDNGEHECSDCGGTGRGEKSDGEYHNQLARMIRKERIRFVNVKDDGSIREDDGCFGVELTCLTKVNDTANLESLCKLLNKLGAQVNKSCGMHVHLDARHLDESQVLEIGKKFKNALPVLLQMVPSTRRNNTYCRPSVSDLSGGRYHAVNLTAYRKYKTVEVRMHSSTTDFNKINNWIQLLTAIAQSKRVPKCETLDRLATHVRISENLLEYISQRISLFSPTLDCTSRAAVDQDSTESESNGSALPLDAQEIGA
jgi:hypothetical protein